MVSILISSSEEYSGKSGICNGLGRILKDRGYSIGYMKPIGNLLIDKDGFLTDEDAEESRTLLGLDDSLSDITPILQTENLIHDALMGVEKHFDKILTDAYSNISRNRDIVFIEGSGGIGSGAMYNLSDPEIASILGSKILLVTRYDSIYAVDRILCDLKLVPDSDMIAGIILNEVPESNLEKVSELVIPYLERKGIKVFGVIPQDITLRSVPISDIVDDLNAEVLTGADNLNTLVERYLVGAMEVNSAIKYFRRVPNCAVITGGDRSDIQLAAIEAKAKCLVLTGNLRPSEAVLGSAEEANIPVILVRGDTMSTIKRMESLIGRARIKQELKIKKMMELINNNVDVDNFIKSIGL